MEQGWRRGRRGEGGTAGGRSPIPLLPPPRPRRDGGEEQEGPGTGEQNKVPSSKRPRVFLGGAQQTAKPGKASAAREGQVWGR